MFQKILELPLLLTVGRRGRQIEAAGDRRLAPAHPQVVADRALNRRKAFEAHKSVGQAERVGP